MFLSRSCWSSLTINADITDPELQDFVQKVAAEVAKLKQSLTTAMQAIGAQGDAAVGELEKLKNDQWMNELLNFRVLRAQLIRKLRSRRLELNVLDRSKARTIDQGMKAHVEKAATAF
ncbi:uncharacterized protein EI90DRAFT_3013188 [Cantharellus anzutake]|uniref:uncharacterized protein n=1 Tax=Cantharellus anzutake TaxID=1750568 RepID=UPI001907B780|nr:uncharacterized protein EI90DRAFT_3013188 [Cantharellus anzutake]KAF8339136.1 hypothetical protein EI90DRAFT_3013188 [Cantharellus anzutake]